MNIDFSFCDSNICLRCVLSTKTTTRQRTNELENNAETKNQQWELSYPTLIMYTVADVTIVEFSREASSAQPFPLHKLNFKEKIWLKPKRVQGLHPFRHRNQHRFTPVSLLANFWTSLWVYIKPNLRIPDYLYRICVFF